MVFGDGEGGEVGLVEGDVGGFLEFFSVDEDRAIFNFQRVAGKGDDAFDPGLTSVCWVEESDEIVALRFPVAVAVFSDEDFVSRIEGGAHRTAGDVKEVQEIFANRESKTDGEGHHEEGEREVDGKTVAVFEPVVFASRKGHSACIPSGVDGRNEGKNNDGDEQCHWWS